MNLSNVLLTLDNIDGDFIKSQSASAEYYDSFGWYGSLETIDVTSMYKFDLTNSGILTFTGYPADPAINPISLQGGWNWIGYIPQNTGDIESALNSIGDTGVFIKNQTESAEYYSDFGWYGSLGLMSGGEGYMLEVSGDAELIYPNFESNELTRNDYFQNKSELNLELNLNPNKYEYNNAITLTLNNINDTHGDYIIAYVGGECRGIAEFRNDYPWEGDYGIYILMTYSNEISGENLHFKYYNSELDEVTEFEETITFIADEPVGNAMEPLVLSRISNPITNALNLKDAYPNPFNPSTELSFSIREAGEVTLNIYDMNGRLVNSLINGNIESGYHSVIWNGRDLNQNAVSSGMYIYTLKNNDISISKKMILMK